MPQRDVILKNQDKTGLLVDRSHQILFLSNFIIGIKIK